MQIKLKPKRFFYVVLLQPSIAPLHSFGNIAKLWKNIQEKCIWKKGDRQIKIYTATVTQCTAVVLRRLHTGGRQRIHLHQSFCIWQILSTLFLCLVITWLVTFEPMSLIHVALNVQMHCHTFCGKQQILESLSLIFECTHLLAPSCQAKKPQEISSLQACSCYSHSNCAFFQITWNRISWFEFSIFYFSIFQNEIQS